MIEQGVSLAMAHFSMRCCDRSGAVLDSRQIEAADVYGALAEVNRHLTREWGRDALIDPHGRIDVATPCGSTVARVICAEAAAGLGRA